MNSRPPGRSRRRLITFVEDRPGHDRRYAIDFSKLHGELGWSPAESFASGLRKTVCLVSREPGLERTDPQRRVSVLDPGTIWDVSRTVSSEKDYLAAS